MQQQTDLATKIRRTLFPGRQERPTPPPTTFEGRVLWLGGIATNWFLLILAIVNMAWVAFDFTYLTLRPFYLANVPDLVAIYDPVKGVSPHRTTQAYLSHARLVLARASEPSATSRALLVELQNRSTALFQEDPFSGAGMAATFEQIKARMRRHMHMESAKQAFIAFWSADNLTPERLKKETAFFNKEIAPNVARNYYRGLGENGQPFDAFWIIDMAFVPFFAFEFLVRGALDIRRRRFPSWKAVAYARWYDLVYFVPIVQYVFPFGTSGWLYLIRAISVGNRMRRMGIINPLEFPQQFANRIVDLITDLVSVRLLTNYQDGIRKFELNETLEAMTQEQRQTVIDFIDRHAQMLVLRILPRMEPDIEALLSFSAREALEQSPTFQRLERIPFIGQLPRKVLPDLIAELTDGMQRSLRSALENNEHRALAQRAVDKFSILLLEELGHMRSEDEFKALLIDVLEQQKRRLLA